MDDLISNIRLPSPSPTTPLSPLPTPLCRLNAHLHGGLPPATLTEVYGTKSSFKTQFILTLAVRHALNGHRVLIADADGTAHHVRLLQIALANASARQSVPDTMKRLFIVQVTDWPCLTAFVHMLPSLIDKTLASFLAIDSMSTLFRTCNELAVSKRLEATAARLRLIAVTHNLYVVVANNARSEEGLNLGHGQGYHGASAEQHTNPVTLSALSAMGEVWRYAIGTRLYLQRQRDDIGSVHIVKTGFCFHSKLAPVHFQVNEAGVREVANSELLSE